MGHSRILAIYYCMMMYELYIMCRIIDAEVMMHILFSSKKSWLNIKLFEGLFIVSVSIIFWLLITYERSIFIGYTRGNARALWMNRYHVHFFHYRIHHFYKYLHVERTLIIYKVSVLSNIDYNVRYVKLLCLVSIISCST